MPKYKMLEGDKGIAVNDKGLPIIINDDGSEAGVDAIHLATKVPELNAEAKGHRLKAKEAEEKLAAFAGIEDPAAAVKALETVANLDAKKLVDAGEIEKMKSSILEAGQAKLDETKKAYEDQIAGLNEKLNAGQEQIFKLMVSDKFKSSPTVETTILPPDMAEAYFGKHFKVEEKDGKSVVVGYMGEDPIYSQERPGEIASFEEALGTVIDKYPMKDRILKGSGGHGSGASGGDGGNFGENFKDLPPTERLKAARRQG